MARLQRWTLPAGAESGAVTIYGRTENWNFFTNTDVTDDLQECKAGLIKNTQPVKSHSRRRYPGDETPITVAAIPDGRKILGSVPKSSGSALPGKTMIMATDPDTWDGGAEKRQFQYVGKFRDLYKYLEQDAEKDIILYNHTGTRYRICAVVAEGG